MAEKGGFEPPVRETRTTVFETAAINRSATSPDRPLSYNRIYGFTIKKQLRNSVMVYLGLRSRNHSFIKTFSLFFVLFGVQDIMCSVWVWFIFIRFNC